MSVRPLGEDERFHMVFWQEHTSIVVIHCKIEVKRKNANACVVPPLPRPVWKENADTTTQTFTAGNYAKITERGSGQY
jgi:hypothetical protein